MCPTSIALEYAARVYAPGVRQADYVIQPALISGHGNQALNRCRKVIVTSGHVGGTSLYDQRHVRETAVGVATAALLLLFIGIHHAWDTVTSLVFVRKQQ